MAAGVIGKIVYSNSSKFSEGDWVLGEWGWANYAIVKEQGLMRVPKNDPNPENYLGIYGVSGLTAWIGLVKIGKIKKGDTVLVSAAAGAVG